jgi:hypothetical protein
MPSSQARSAPACALSADPKLLWNEIVRWTFEVCILRREGNETAVAPLLRDRLPPLIQAWSRNSGHSAEGCRQQLRALFSRVQESVEIGCIHRRMIVEEVCTRLGAAGTPIHASRPVGIHLRRRISLDDVPEMLDALAEAELAGHGESILPLRTAVVPPVPHFAAEPTSQIVLTA